MLIEKFEIFLALFAGLIILIIGFWMNFSLPAILLRLLIVLVVFYIIGLAAKTYLRKKIFFEIETEEEIDNDENIDGEEVLAEANEAGENTENQPAS